MKFTWTVNIPSLFTLESERLTLLCHFKYYSEWVNDLWDWVG